MTKKEEVKKEAPKKAMKPIKFKDKEIRKIRDVREEQKELQSAAFKKGLLVAKAASTFQKLTQLFSEAEHKVNKATGKWNMLMAKLGKAYGQDFIGMSWHIDLEKGIITPPKDDEAKPVIKDSTKGGTGNSTKNSTKNSTSSTN